MGAKMVKAIAIYGKRGIGKSAIAANLSAALGWSGYQVMQVGCSLKSDSSRSLLAGKPVRSVFEALQERPSVKPDEVVSVGFGGVYCVEAVGSTPGGVWPSNAILTANRFLRESEIFGELGLDFVVYDVPGDDAGGNFYAPVRNPIADHIFTVLSADFSAIRAANTLFREIRKQAESNGPLVGGVIANFIDAPYTAEIVDDFAGQAAIAVVAHIPRSEILTRSEQMEKTVIECFAGSAEADIFIRLAEKIIAHDKSRVPYSMDANEMWLWSGKWNNRLIAMTTGEGAGACI